MVRITQNIYPNSITQKAEIERPEEVTQMARFILEAGYEFDVDMLPQSSLISMSVKKEHKTVYNLCADKDLNVLESFDELVRGAFMHLAEDLMAAKSSRSKTQTSENRQIIMQKLAYVSELMEEILTDVTYGTPD